MNLHLRRGVTTDAIFTHAIDATCFFASSEPQTGRGIARQTPLTVDEARARFTTHKRARMYKRPDGVFFFLIGTGLALERIELYGPTQVARRALTVTGETAITGETASDSTLGATPSQEPLP